ncbi:Metallo-dependent phosphatase-like protein [Mucidula mucida]|nr:Metallo-dependent phosphatase-like protein [Mucidula mucida]
MSLVTAPDNGHIKRVDDQATPQLKVTVLMICSIAALSLLSSLVAACADEGHSHGHYKRAVPSSPLTPPWRPLEWGDIIFSTLRTHTDGFSDTRRPHFLSPITGTAGDLGDFASFVAHMKEIAIAKDVDLLLVDSGDLHDGTGLSDGFPPGGIDAHESNEFLKQLPYDVMAIGNHELYIYNNTLDMHQNFAPALNGRYLSSNVNITYVDADNEIVDVPVGVLGSALTNAMHLRGRQVTALGVLFDFTGNDNGTTVQKVESMVKEPWFLEAIQDEPDLFLLAGHMPVVKDNWPVVFDAIRAVHAETPIMILGGHTHIRDCIQLDDRSMSLESGRYMETIGWMSLKMDEHDQGKLTFSRRYLDANRVTYEYHTAQEPVSFDTMHGRSLTQGLNELAADFDLNFTYGTAPRDFTISQSPYPSNGSQLSLFIELATPYTLSLNNSRSSIPNIMVTNSGSQRFDIYAGPFTKNDQITASPFEDGFLYIPEVPLSAALETIQTMNSAGSDNRRRSLEREEELYRRGDVTNEMDRRYTSLGRREDVTDNITLGYVTTDSCPGIGDDTLHTALSFYPYPDFVASKTPDVSNDTLIDFVFVDFIVDQVIETLNTVQSNTTFVEADAGIYGSFTSQDVLGEYAKAAWN